MDAAEGFDVIREIAIVGLALAGVALVDLGGAGSREFDLRDDFDAGISRDWAVRQQEQGTLDTVAAPGRAGRALRARTAPKRGRVTKAALIARTTMRHGSEVRIAFDLYVPSPTPLNSLQLVDLECATCGEGGNPGIRLYLRRGRLRIDRSKIGSARAWLDDAAPGLAPNRWHRIALTVRLGADGAARVWLDGRHVLAARGATILAGSDHADRIQIGITANSNPVAATALFDNVVVRVR